jgi:hypothetical protein
MRDGQKSRHFDHGGIEPRIEKRSRIMTHILCCVEEEILLLSLTNIMKKDDVTNFPRFFFADVDPSPVLMQKSFCSPTKRFDHFSSTPCICHFLVASFAFVNRSCFLSAASTALSGRLAPAHCLLCWSRQWYVFAD